MPTFPVAIRKVSGFICGIFRELAVLKITSLQSTALETPGLERSSIILALE
jgi:hypothetical protein